MSMETLEKYSLASAEMAYENLGVEAPMGLMSFGGEIQGSENTLTMLVERRISH